MKIYKYQIILILILILASCQDELELNNIENNQNQTIVEKTKYGTGKIPEEFAVTYQKNTNEIEVLYFGERISATDENNLNKKFYSDVSFLISAAWGDSTENWKFNIKPAESAFRNYTHYEIDFYGMARRGNFWRENRMIR